MSHHQHQNIATIQTIAKDRFGIIVNETRAQRLLSNQLKLWSLRNKQPLEALLSQALICSEDNPVLKDFISYVTVGESYFFRHKEQLTALVSWVKDHIDHPVRIWSAACSIGCEVYSLAYLLKEAGIQYHLLGTDIDRTRLNIASNLGPYSKHSIRSKNAKPQDLLALTEDGYWVESPWAYNCHFRYHNLQTDDYPRPSISYNGKAEWDVIICRNAFIYFNQDQTKGILHKMANCLSDEGSLWVGVNDALFETANVLHPSRWNNHTLHTKNLVPRLNTVPSQQTKATLSPPIHNALPKYQRQPSTKVLQRCLQQGYQGIAKEMLKELLTKDPFDIPLNLTLCTLYTNDQQFSLALKTLQYLSERHPDLLEIEYFIGLVEYTRNNLEEAEQCFLHVLSLDSTFWPAHLYLGTIRIKNRLWLQAKIKFDEALHLLRSDTTLHFQSLTQPHGFHEDAKVALEYTKTQLSRLL